MRWNALATRQKSARSDWVPDMVPIEFAHVPSRHKPARKRALLFWLAACAVAMVGTALMVLYAP